VGAGPETWGRWSFTRPPRPCPGLPVQSAPMVRPIVEVAVNVPLLRNFHYTVPKELGGRLELGHRVLVPFGPRTATGVCVGFPSESEVPKLKPVRDVLHPECRFDAHLLELTRWIADYYHVGWGEVLEAALPPPIRQQQREPRVAWLTRLRTRDECTVEAERVKKKAPQQAVALTYFAGAGEDKLLRTRVIAEAPCGDGALRSLVKKGWFEVTQEPKPSGPSFVDSQLSAASAASAVETLHADQETALKTISEAVEAGGFAPILIQGVTGSGKTEVYVRALRSVLEAGGRGIVLVPEISLTPQTVTRFREGLPEFGIRVLHSMLTPAARRREWQDIQAGKADVVIGARSSIFAPLERLNLIVIDEEHDSSYKQESSPRYSARDVAIVRARMLGIPVLLGSATPTLESAWNATSGKYRHVVLPRRVTSHDLPVVSIEPLGGEFYRPDGSGLITDRLDYRIRKCLRAGEQVILFLNRRGFATYLHCFRCGYVLTCDNCDIALTFHRRENAARCHYCGQATGVPQACPECKVPGLRRAGVGTEKVATQVAKRYPDARVIQLDRDTVTTYQGLQDAIRRFSEGEFDILVGTQMIAKGHDFPSVTLVGVINADTGLHFPDFRAAERTFQLVTQVAGRAGRGQRPGHVIIQTFVPDHYAIDYAARAQFEAFLEKELSGRRALSYPPFGRLVKILIQGEKLEVVQAEAEALGSFLKQAASEGEGERVQVLGPAPSPLERIQRKYRYQLLLKSKSSKRLHQLLHQLDHGLPRPKRGAERSVDVDPQSML
jgi:primosomal protein N' (replication factor Y)